jgi:hypothetical protein
LTAAPSFAIAELEVLADPVAGSEDHQMRHLYARMKASSKSSSTASAPPHATVVVHRVTATNVSLQIAGKG